MDYIEKARKITKTPLMLTGGFRTTSVMKDAVASNQLDIVGIARPFAVYPTIGNDICNESKINFNNPQHAVDISKIYISRIILISISIYD